MQPINTLKHIGIYKKKKKKSNPVEGDNGKNKDEINWLKKKRKKEKRQSLGKIASGSLSRAG